MNSERIAQEYISQADTLYISGDLVGAIHSLKSALKHNSRNFQDWIKLSKFLYQNQEYLEATRIAQSAERFDPLQNDFLLVQKSIQSFDYNRAQTLAKGMLKAVPGHPRAIFTLAHLAQIKGNPDAQIEILGIGLHYSPANTHLRNMLQKAHETSGSYKKAIETAYHITDLDTSFGVCWNLIQTLLRYGQNDAVLAACERAELSCKGNQIELSKIELVRGQVLRVLGDKENSIIKLHESLAHNPENTEAWWALADLKTYTFSDADESSLMQLINQPKILPSEKSQAMFSLARAYEMGGNWKKAMPLYKKANALRISGRFEANDLTKAGDRLIEAFSKDTLQDQANQESASPTPIFIIGLPRSGSTLIEQILASHSKIEGTMEQPLLPAVKQKAHLKCVELLGGAYLSNIGHLPTAELTQLGQIYLQKGRLFRKKGLAYFTDKMPFNFEHIGLIHKILPQAKIIDARRNPLDCGLSLFKQSFSQGSEFSYDLGHIGAYYNMYLKIMDHWDTVLPGKVMTLQYEDLVRTPKTYIKKLLEYIEVPFEENCLNFHQTKRAVRTASSEQVRQPIYKQSIGVWREVGSELQILKDSLGSRTLNRFSQYIG